MAFFSMEHSTFKTWLVAKQRLCGAILPCMFSGIAYLLVLLFRSGSEACLDYIMYCFGCGLLLEAIFVSAYKTTEEKGYVGFLYTMLALLPAIGVGLVIAKVLTNPLISTALIVWWCISIIIGILPAKVIWRYAYRNFDTQVSEIDRRLMGQGEYEKRRTSFAYGRSVETYLISVVSVAALGALFV